MMAEREHASVNTLGLLLAGGLSRRMGGGDKALRPLGGRTLLDHVIDRMRPQVAALVLNANGDPARFAGFGLPVVADSVPDFAGPLAGILAGLDWAAAQPAGLPRCRQRADRRAVSAARSGRAPACGNGETAGAELACAASGGQPHPVVGLWPVRLRDALREAVVDEGIRKVDVWTGRYRLRRWTSRRSGRGSTRSSTPTGPRISTAPRNCSATRIGPAPAPQLSLVGRRICELCA